MNEHALTSDELKLKYSEDIAKGETFKTIGLTKKAATDYLNTTEGDLFYRRLVEADPNASAIEINDRAIKQLTSGRELPRMEIIDELVS
jgi:hypothetical protein